MKIKQIKINDIKHKKYWRIESFNDNNMLEAIISEVKKINKNDIILHSAVLVVKEKQVFPSLITKYYEDDGEVGDHFILSKGEWVFFNSSIEINGEIEGEYLSYISILDIHEYQKGSFDNRKFHYDRFDFYSKQIGSNGIKHFKNIESKIPKKILTMNRYDQINYIKKNLLEVKELHNNNQISKGNKKIIETGKIISYLKLNKENHPFLKELLNDKEKYIQRSMMYDLIDIYREDCIKIMKLVAKENSLEGMAAKENLKSL